MNMNNGIESAVIITDCVDVSFIEMYQSLRNELSMYGIHTLHISPLVPVKSFSVVNASFHIRLLADVFPATKTIFIVVVHGIRSNPERIFGKTKHGLTFVGNNSGYFNWLLEDFGLACIYENNINRSLDGRSFGGKYVQIPTAAKIIADVPFEEIGVQRSSAFLNNYGIHLGAVVHVDNFGLMKIYAPKLIEFAEGQQLQIMVNGIAKVTAVYTEKMKRQNDGQWVLFNGSSLYGLPELGRVRSYNSAQELGVVEGDIITWQKLT